MAQRLSADPACRVLLLEAGRGLDDAAASALTANGLQLPIGSASPLVRRYQTSITEEPPRTATVMRGEVVGGSGAVNGGYFCRGLPGDFDSWDLPGWYWADVLPHFRAIERDHDFGARAEHGDSGPIDVRRTPEITGSSELFAQSAMRAGLRWIEDLNGFTDPRSSAVGVGAVPLNIVDGVRKGPGHAVLQPVLRRHNLTVRPGSQARRIRFVGDRATGVEVIGAGGASVVSADRIILSAGAIGSAQLLMLSGIGPPKALRSLGIPVIAGLPVGQRFADHPEWVLPTHWPVHAGRPVVEVAAYVDDVEIRPYTGGFIAMTGDLGSGEPDWPHLGVALMRPRARGRLALVSADITVAPRIEHRYDADPADAEALRRGAQWAAEIAGSATRVGEPAWSTTQHLCGTAPMGRPGAENAVLDERCAVRGVDGLWVIDGSSLPDIPSRGPHATIAMMAHRAAEFVTAPV